MAQVENINVTTNNCQAVTVLEAKSLIAANGLKCNKLYHVTNASNTDLGVKIHALSSNSLSLHGEGGFLNPDFQDVGNYDGVSDITGITKATNRGVWYADGESVYEDGDIVFWNGLHYQMTDMGAVDNTDPETNTDAYTVLPKSAENVGYIEEWDFINYDLSNDRITKRIDIRQNYIENTIDNDIVLFQWGNNLVIGNRCDISAFNCLNNRGTIAGNNVSGGSNIYANQNKGSFLRNSVNTSSNINIENNEGTVINNSLNNVSEVNLNRNKGTVTSLSFTQDNDFFAEDNEGLIDHSSFDNSNCTIELNSGVQVSGCFFKSTVFTANATENILSQTFDGTTQSEKLVGTEVFAITDAEDYVQKIYVDTLQTAGNDITFDRPRQFGTFTTPRTGAITNTLTGAVIGKIQKIYHQDSF